VCGAAERTLPTNGAEVPFEGRRRLTLDARVASFMARDGLRVSEQRIEPAFAVALGADAMVGVLVPVLRRVLRDEGAGPLPGNAAQEGPARVSLGDVEIRGSHLAWRSTGAPSRRLTLHAGLKLPTAPTERRASGDFVSPDLQPGCASLVPFVEVSYAWVGTLVSVWASAGLLVPFSVRAAPHPGDSFRAALTLQLQPAAWIATRLGLVGRADTVGQTAEGAAAAGSGGAQVQLVPEIAVSPLRDVVVSVGASFPTVQAMRSYRLAAPVALLGVGVDF
jgi:hypothetical protein